MDGKANTKNDLLSKLFFLTINEEVLMESESEEKETVCCDNCGCECDRIDSDLCSDCGHDNKEQFDDKYGEVD